MITKLTIRETITVYACVLLLFSFSIASIGQSKTYDSSHKAYQLIKKAESTTSSEEKIKLVKEADQLLVDENDSELKFQAYQKAGILLFDIKANKLAQNYLLKALNNSKEESSLAIGGIENYLGWIESANCQYKKAIQHFEKAIDIYSKHKEADKLGNAYNSLGAMHWYLREYEKALANFEQVLKIGEENDNATLTRKALTNKGVVLNILAQYNEALTCLEKALELNLLENDIKNRAVLLINIGNINNALKRLDAAFINYEAALKIYRELGDEEGISTCYNNIGEIYLKTGKISEAIQHYHTSLDISRREDDTVKMAMTYLNIGRAHQSGEQYNEAIDYFEKVLKLMLSFEDPSLKAETYLHLGQTLLIKQQFDQAFDYLNKATNIAKSLDEKAKLAQSYNSLADWHKAKGNYKEALEFKTQYIDLSESLTDEKALLNSARMEAVYKLLNKEQQISILEQDNINKSESLKLLRNSRTAYIIVVGFLLIVVLILILNYRIRRKTARLLKIKNNELNQLNNTKDKFFSIIAHDLKSPFSSLMGFAEMLVLNAESKNTREVIEYSQIIHNSTKRLLGLVENLLQWSRTQIGTTEYKPTQLDISIQTHNIVSLLRLNAEEKDIVISPKIERNLVAWADENLYNTILRNLISNAIKFSRVGSVIYVNASRKKDMIEVSVADSGVGIRQENLERLFMVDSTFSTKGTLNEKGTGLGLVLCKEFVEINKGQIWAESELEKGSTFYFTLPVLETK
ncbi:MAG: tetratricopeptide repeat-containing sensor histidine kinase [Carboxylicivirga sp.]|jgi:signal transduction histidine kinase|nr:tetratricopeptide repeat-containing sensor histidine kinase [Carboxylicivirga sp.]